MEVVDKTVFILLKNILKEYGTAREGENIKLKCEN